MLSEPMLVARLEQAQLEKEHRLNQSIAWTKDYIANGDWDASSDELAYLHDQLKELEQCLNPNPHYNRQPLSL